MRNLSHSKLLNFLTLVLIMLVGLGSLVYFQYEPVAQMVVAVWLGFAYVVWGALIHWQKGDLNIKILLEYILIAALIVVVLITLLLRA